MPAAVYGYGLPPDISTHGAGIDQLITILHWFMLLLFVIWGAFLSYTLWNFRARPGHQASYHPHHFSWPKYLEIGVALFEIMLLSSFSMPLMFKLKQAFPRPGPNSGALEIRVVAEQFAWNFHYAGKDGKFGRTDPTMIDSTTNPLGRDAKDPAGKDDASSVNSLHIPVNRPIICYITSKDVIHSFNLPVLRIKQDAIPGEVIPVWFQAKQTGDFEVACAQLCGDQHFKMVGKLIVEEPEAFQKWLDAQVKNSVVEGSGNSGKEEKEEFEK